MLVAWLVFPAVLGVLALGCGLLLERIAGMRVAGPLVAPLGLAVIIVVAGFLTLAPGTARFTVPAVIAIAVAGFGCGAIRGRVRAAMPPFAAAALVFCVYAAPVVLSGQATFAGYIKLDDTATFLALTDRVMEHGRSLAGLAPSSYEATLAVNLGHGYPVGALLPFGVGRTLVGVDGAWVYQPYVAFLAAMLALVLYELAGYVVRPRRLRAVAAALAAQPALLYGFALWGGIKELAAAPVVALVAALTRTAGEQRFRRLLPLATAVAALLGELSVGGVVWLLAPAVAAVLFLIRRRTMAARIGALGATVGLLSLPSLVAARSFLGAATVLRQDSVLGNLLHPLNKLQVFGVWPTGDFRLSPSDLAATWILVATVAGAALVGCLLACGRRAWAFLLYLASALGGCAVLVALGSPWVVAKAYAIASPAFVLAAAVGCAGLIVRKRVTEGTIGLVAIAGGVLWSNALAYHDVNLAPRQQLVELERIGDRFAGQGPTLMTEYQPYGVRHFLRALDAEGVSELRRRPIPLRNGEVLAKGAYADLTAFQPSALRVYRTLVLRRSPLASRPPAVYRLVWSGRFYDVWQRARAFGRATDVRPGCSVTRSLSGVSMSRSASPRAIVLGLGSVDHPSAWPVAAGGEVVYPSGPGEIHAQVRLSANGRYSVWVGGSFRNRLAALIDGREIGDWTDQLNNSGQFTLLGSATLATGARNVELRYSSSMSAPGSAGPEYGLGPLVVSRDEPRC
jgi:hypothetical protein